MPTKELDALMQREDKQGNKEILYPVTKIDNVLGADEIPAAKVKFGDGINLQEKLSSMGGIPAGDCTNISAQADSGQITIKWNDPEDIIIQGALISGWERTTLVRKTGSYPENETDGVLVLTNTVRNQYADGFIDTEVTIGITYCYKLFPVGKTGAVNTNAANNISATVSIVLDRTFGNNSWAAISAGSAMIEANGWNAEQVAENLGWNVGDLKTITMNEIEHSLRILDFNHDDKSDGSGKAGVSLELAPACYGATSADKVYMNPTNSNEGGWEMSYMRQTVIPEMKALLPQELQAVIKPVYKRTSRGNQDSAIVTTTDELWLLAECEVYSSSPYTFPGEGTQYALYVPGLSSNRIKVQGSSKKAASWWERSPTSVNSERFRMVDAMGRDGGNLGTMASDAFYITFGLCV